MTFPKLAGPIRPDSTRGFLTPPGPNRGPGHDPVKTLAFLAVVQGPSRERRPCSFAVLSLPCCFHFAI